MPKLTGKNDLNLPLIKVTLIFVTIILISRFYKARLWLCLTAGAAAIGFLFGMDCAGTVSTFWRTSSSYKTIEVLIILYGIAVFEYTLRVSGMLTRLVLNLKKVLGDDRLVLGTLPAFLGFLPSPGGALFSAPLVEEAAKNIEISPEQKSFINYWFRHIWETAFPLFPGLIFAAAMSGIPLYKLAWIMLPIVFINIATGSIIVFHTKFKILEPDAHIARHKFNLSLLYDLFINLLPILIIITGALFLKMNIILLITAGILWTFIQSGVSRTEIKKIFYDTMWSQNLMLIVAIMFFAGILEDSGAAAAIPETFVAMNIPKYAIFMGMPFILAIFTGINTAFVGLSFPILAKMAGGSLNPDQVTLIYLSGCAGVMLSPVHLCFILTLNYFKANIFSFYKMLMLPVAVMLACAAIFGRL